MQCELTLGPTLSLGVLVLSLSSSSVMFLRCWSLRSSSRLRSCSCRAMLAWSSCTSSSLFSFSLLYSRLVSDSICFRDSTSDSCRSKHWILWIVPNTESDEWDYSKYLDYFFLWTMTPDSYANRSCVMSCTNRPIPGGWGLKGAIASPYWKRGLFFGFVLSWSAEEEHVCLEARTFSVCLFSATPFQKA